MPNADPADDPSPKAGRLYYCEHFGDAADLARRLEDSLFRYCGFHGFEIEGGHVTSIFDSTTFSKLDWYWGLFNICLFAACRFEDCTFRGTNFPDCKFVECVFVRCRFVKDNVGGECRFDDTKWYGCLQFDCDGLPTDVPVSDGPPPDET